MSFSTLTKQVAAPCLILVSLSVSQDVSQSFIAKRTPFVTLWDLAAEQAATIESFNDHLSHLLVHRVEALGLVPDASVTCLKHSAFNGPMVVQSNEMVVAIERELAEQIKVRLREHL